MIGKQTVDALKGATEAHMLKWKTTKYPLFLSFIDHTEDTGLNKWKWVFSGITMATLKQVCDLLFMSV